MKLVMDLLHTFLNYFILEEAVKYVCLSKIIYKRAVVTMGTELFEN